MNSTPMLLSILIGQFLLFTVVAICEQRFALALYWAGAVILNIGVLLMNRI